MSKLRLAVEYFHPWTNDAGYHVAAAEGTYAACGIELRQVVSDPLHGDSLHDLITGEADLAVCPTNRLLVRREAGHDLVALAPVNHRAMETIQTLVRSRIERPADITGRTLALNPTPRGLALVRHVIERDGGDFGRVRIVDTGSREINADDLADGVADAFFGAYWAWDALFGAVPEHERRTWPVDEIGAPRYHSYVIASHRSLFAEQPRLVADFLAATERGVRAAATRPDDALDVLARTIPFVRRTVLAQSLALVAPTWFDASGEWGVHDDEVHAEYSAWLASVGIVRDATVWRDVVVHAAPAGTDTRAAR
jgi:NitT/TauT family transport system substrate-binding protein